MKEDINIHESSESINFGRYLRLILLQSKLIAIITISGLIIGLLLYFSTSKTYKISSLLQVYNPSQGYDTRRSLTADFFNSADTNLDNLTSLYLSRTNILKLIENLGLNIIIDGQNNLIEKNIKYFVYKNINEYEEKEFLLEKDKELYRVYDNSNNLLFEATYNETFINDNFEVLVEDSSFVEKEAISISYRKPSDFFNLYKNSLKVNTTQSRRSLFTQEGLLEVEYVTSNESLGKKIVNAANEIFINDGIEAESEKAKKVISFIDKQIGSLENILDVNKNELKDFKQENKSLNVNLEVQSIINRISDIEEKISKADLDLSKAEINFTKNNPLFENLIAQKKALEFQKTSVEKEIENLPLAQQEYIDIFRDLEISEELYSELANRRLNYSLIEASTLGNIRVIDEAYVKSFEGPFLLSVIYMTFIFFFMGLIVAVFRGIFFIAVSNPAELKDAGIKTNIVGVVPRANNPENPFEDKRFDQSIETLILNIETIIGNKTSENNLTNCKKIVFTSPTPENGKSFVSRSFAEGLSKIGNKVLLVDVDLKRGDQHKFFNKDSITLDYFKNISEENLEELKVGENLYLIPKLSKLKNTFEYLYGNIFIEKIEKLESSFDYIIMDTAPILNVSDTGLILSSVETNFMIIRHELTKINELKQSMQIIDQVGRKFDGCVYNSYERPKGYYGYYDIYGDYSYRYYAERYLYDDYQLKDD